MNILQALSGITELSGVSPVRVFDTPPASPPVGLYAVVSELREDTDEAKFSYDVAELIVLVTIYGAEGMSLPALRPTYSKVKQLVRVITAHPGMPYFAGITLSSRLPPTQSTDSKRPFGGVRFALKYVENA